MLQPFLDGFRSCPKSGLHNPIKNPERYLLYGQVSFKAAAALADPEVGLPFVASASLVGMDLTLNLAFQVEHFFARLIQRVSPKSLPQARAEVVVTRKFLENFSGDQVRFLARSFTVPGDHSGQRSEGLRWPYGPVSGPPHSWPSLNSAVQPHG